MTTNLADVTAYAQSNIQLFLQLQQAGASATELRRLGDTCRLAMQLYTGQFLVSGKPTLGA